MTEIEVRRSARRTRTVQARREGDRTIVMIPARMSRAEEKRVVRELVAKLDARSQRRTRLSTSDTELEERARELASRYVPEAPEPASVRWVSNQNHRWGSCTHTDRTIRLSDRLRGMPDTVIDAVLVHEIAHLIEPNHGPEFSVLASRFEKMEWAMGFLDGASWQQPTTE